MRVNIYNRINNLKGKIKIEKKSIKSLLSIKGKKTLLAITASAVVLTSLTGCSVSNNATSIQTQTNNYNAIVESPKTTEQNANNYNNTIASTASTTSDYSLSYNRFLYSSGNSLDTTVSINDFSETDGISKSGNNADRRLATGEFVGTEISVDNQSFSEFIKFIDSKDVIYVYEDYYNIDEALNKTGATTTPSVHTHTLITRDTNLTTDLLVETILKNNEDYLKEYPEFYTLPEEDIKEIASYVIESLESHKEDLTPETEDRVYCQISNLKVVGFDSADPTVNPGGNIINAQYCTDNTIVIDKKQISLLPSQDAKAKTFKHEINHIYHRVCEDELDSNYQLVGISQFWEDLKVNPLFWRWHYEAASESMVMSEYNTTQATVYKNFVNYLRSLDLVALLNPNYQEDAMEISTLNNNPEDLFKCFNATTDEEKKEIIKLMYSIDYIQIEREDLENEYERRTGTEMKPSLQVKYEMKKSICTTLAKYFYRNLAERINNDNVTLEDVFYLINVFEADLNTHILYDEAYDEDIRRENEYFLSEYIEIQDNFFSMIAQNNNLREDELINQFNNYAMIIQSSDNTYSRNAELKWLDESERNFIYSILTHNITSFTNNIRNLYSATNHEYIRK